MNKHHHKQISLCDNIKPITISNTLTDMIKVTQSVDVTPTQVYENYRVHAKPRY